MLKRVIKYIYWNILYRLLKLFPLQEKVFFESFLGKSYSDGPKAMYEYMRDNDYKYRYIWSLNEPNILKDSQCVSVKRMSVSYLYHLATAKYIVNNSRMPDGYTKRSGQIIVQTWHGTPLKRLVFDMENVTLPKMDKETYLKSFKKDVDNWDYLISPNEFSTEKFKSAFRFEKQIIEHGYPRNQELIDINEAKILKLKKQLNIPANNRVILYAPTFRDNNYKSESHYIQEINIDFNKIDMKNTTFILRNHYLVSEIKYKYNQPEHIIDLTDYANINDLYAIADILITDYSSVFFDFMLLKRPIIFYQYDQKEYADDIRGFYIPVEELPGVVAKSESELYDAINNPRQSNYSKFSEKYHLLNEEKEITKKVVNAIFKKGEQ